VSQPAFELFETILARLDRLETTFRPNEEVTRPEGRRITQDLPAASSPPKPSKG
jgi:hypothetical protein